MKYLVSNGHPQFRQSLRKKSQLIAETASMLYLFISVSCK